MERHHATTSLDSPLQFFPVSEKQMLSNTSKMKNTGTATNRKTHESSQKIMQRVKKLSHTFKNSTLRKNKSKCQTEAHQSVKKRHAQNQSHSKKTLRKRKHQKAENQFTNKLKLSYSKNEEESVTLKSSGKRNWPKKQMFHSTCFSRHLDQDLEMLESIVQVSSDAIGHRSLYSQNLQKNNLDKILQRTKTVLFTYQSKCEQLQKSCSYYKNELSQAKKKIEQLQRKTSANKVKTKLKSTEPKQSVRSTNGFRNQKS